VLYIGGAVVKPVVAAAQTSKRRHGRTLVRFIIGPLFALLVIAVVIPGLLPVCGCGSPEARAIGILRAVASAQSTFATSCGGNGYAQSLEDLVNAPTGSTAGFLSADVSPNGVIIDGYVYTVMARPEANTVTEASQTCNRAKADTVSDYFAEAHPLRIGKTSHRSFATDDRGVIYVSNTGEAITPNLAGASVLQ
jgi:hypothetical protein